jgi:quercetin dioxygenase-like cupin family protein
MQPTVSRKDLLTAVISRTVPVSRVEVKEVTMGAGQNAPLHLHPCTTVGVVTEGTITFQIEGMPEEILKPGDAFHEPKDARISKFNNEGTVPAKFVVFYLLDEQGKDTIKILDK